MIYKRKIVVLFSSVWLCANMNAQSYPQELLRYSMNDLNGTARSIGAGGAFSTVGADMSNAFSNPAGLGLYRGTEITGSLGVLANGTNTAFLNAPSQSNSVVKAYAPNAGIVFSIPHLRSGKSTNFVQIGLAYQHLADFNNTRTFSGTNNYNSQVDGLFSEIMATNYPIEYDYYSPQAVQAWQTYLIDTSNGYFFQRAKAPVNQIGTYSERGGSNEIAFTISGSINDKVYIGGGIGVPWVSYSRDITYSEAAARPDSVYGFQNFTQLSSYTASGVGVNLKFGIIARPFQWWRIGASIVTPSWFGIREQQAMTTVSNILRQNVSETAYSDTFTSAPYNFNYTKPLKFTLGTSFYLTKWGFLSIDYELNDYGHTKLNFPGSGDLTAYYQNQMNSYYTIGHTLRAGVEIAPLSVLRVRAGYMFNSSPFQSGAQVRGYNLQQNTATLGVGYRGKVFFVDLAYAYSAYGQYQSLYTEAANEPAMLTKYHNHRVVLTLGIHFESKYAKK